MDVNEGMMAAPAQPAGPPDIEAVMTAHETALLRYATRLVRNPTLAQDVVQDTFIRFVRTWRDGAHPAEALGPWLYRVTHNVAVDYLRRENRLRFLHDRHAREREDVAPAGQRRQLERAEALEAARNGLRTLDPAEQQVAVLRFQEGRSYKEIGEITGRSEGNVGCLLHHAVKNLAAHLKKAGVV